MQFIYEIGRSLTASICEIIAKEFCPFHAEKQEKINSIKFTNAAKN
jgi:hypothetical protein